MAEDAARDTGATGARPLRISPRGFIARVTSEEPVEGRWPVAWRIIFLFGTAIGLWFAAISLLRWS